MSPAPVPPLTTLPDGTIKQVNPFSGTEVWTVSSRAHRPVAEHHTVPFAIDEDNRDTQSDFGIANKLRTTPEKARMVIDDNGDPRILRGMKVSELEETVPMFRRVANLYEILSPTTTGR
jgi:galactose-1-phosphate uridylyltransferase